MFNNPGNGDRVSVKARLIESFMDHLVELRVSSTLQERVELNR